MQLLVGLKALGHHIQHVGIMNILMSFLNYDWELTKSPAGAHQWTPTSGSNAKMAPNAGNPNGKQALMMTTADMALKNRSRIFRDI